MTMQKKKVKLYSDCEPALHSPKGGEILLAAENGAICRKWVVRYATNEARNG